VKEIGSTEVDDADTIVVTRQLRRSQPGQMPLPALPDQELQSDKQNRSTSSPDYATTSNSERANSTAMPPAHEALQLPQQAQAVHLPDIEQATQQHFGLGVAPLDANHGAPTHMRTSAYAFSNMPNLDFFDPFLGNTFEQFQLPNLPDSTTHFSPLEQMSPPCRGDSSDNSSDINLRVSQPLEIEIDVMILEVDDQTQLPQPQSTWFNNTVTRSIAQLPQVVKLPAAKHPPITFTDAMQVQMQADLSSRVGLSQMNNFHLPGATALQKCLRTYVDAFHVHLPILHLQSLNFMQTPSPLILALCAIGALYRLERKIAANLYIKAVQALSTQDVDSIDYMTAEKLLRCWETPNKISRKAERPLWVSQARLLLLFFSAFSGEPSTVRRSIEELGYLTNVRRFLCVEFLSLTIL